MIEKLAVVVVGQDAEALAAIIEGFTATGICEVRGFIEPEAAARACVERAPDLLLSAAATIDQALELCRAPRDAIHKRCDLLLCAGLDEGAVGRAFQAGARDFIPWPEREEALRARLRRCARRALKQARAELERIGPYEVLEEVGRGGMGVVYKVRCPRSAETLALKILHRHDEDELTIALRFRREIDVLQSLEHPGLTRVRGIGRDGSRLYYIMDFVPGENLGQRMWRLGRLPAADIVAVLEQTCEALAYMHGFRIVHRDIKPANIMMDGEGKVTLTDFGLSKVLMDQQLTATGQAVGTPHFMAPEVITGADYDERADLFSLGMVMFELMLGGEVVSADTAFELMTRIAEGRFPRPKQALAGLGYPDGLLELLEELLAIDPERRCQSAAEVLERLEALPGQVAPGAGRGLDQRGPAATTAADTPPA